MGCPARRGDHPHLAGHDGADLHLIRRSLSYASYTGRKVMAAGLRGVYDRLRRGRGLCRAGRFLRHGAGEEVPGGRRGLGAGVGSVYTVPGIRPAMRKVLYTTNATESFNREMRKGLKARTQFPDDDSVAKKL